MNKPVLFAVIVLAPILASSPLRAADTPPTPPTATEAAAPKAVDAASAASAATAVVTPQAGPSNVGYNQTFPANASATTPSAFERQLSPQVVEVIGANSNHGD